MIRIIGINLNKNNIIKYALMKIHGIGLSSAKAILKKAKINSTKRILELSNKNLIYIRKIIELHYKVEQMLKYKIREDLNLLQRIKIRRGIRYTLNLPVRGQRTRTNARLRRGNKKTVAGKKK
jgi:small subunit ribosomal protein S13